MREGKMRQRSRKVVEGNGRGESRATVRYLPRAVPCCLGGARVRTVLSKLEEGESVAEPQQAAACKLPPGIRVGGCVEQPARREDHYTSREGERDGVATLEHIEWVLERRGRRAARRASILLEDVLRAEGGRVWVAVPTLQVFAVRRLLLRLSHLCLG